MTSNTTRSAGGTTLNPFPTTTLTHSTDTLGATATIIESMSATMNRLFDCNMRAAQGALDRASAATAQMIGAKTPNDLMLLAASQAQAGFESIANYWRDLTSLAVGEQCTSGQATPAQPDRGNKAAANASAGFDNLLGMTSAAFDNANKLYGQWAEASEKALQAMHFDTTGGSATGADASKKAGHPHKRTNGQSHPAA